MEGLLSSLCTILVVLAFCQILVEAVLPEGSLKRYVTFLTGIVTVLVVLGLFVRPQASLTALIGQGLLPAPQPTVQATPAPAGNPYEDYLRKLIEEHR